MVQETILQHWIFTNFAFPFLLMFFVVFAILEKTKLLGEDKKQLNALLSFIVSLVFVGAIFPKLVVENMILFLSVSMIIVFVGLLLWGFITGQEAKIDTNGVKIAVGIVLVLVLIGAILWATGWYGGLFDFITGSSIGSSFWTNVLFIVMIAVALAIVLKTGKGS